ncbi:bifunctional glycosyltransferase family 2/GtrA family protein [Paenisporosarcina sp. TG20]|uniref:bifunctional glycosyltransferase family 2/GtrA family protein n=1 Tax=Paenisporosarcina sp. TG20 TaxID=1211706 RepID=UPI0003147130|nr:bifunctional glycosyltransferase family 2/GtrA family protein [Paenisporosarcina sp. TG20]
MDKTCIIIPAYKPTDLCLQTVEELIKVGFTNILVINDGSGQEFTPIFEEIEHYKEVTVLHHAANQGKGRALKTAFHFFLNELPHIQKVITVDADGQHLTKDICSLHHASIHKAGIILGVRNFKQKNIPFRSRFGNNLTRNLFGYTTGIGISDTQTGLRLFLREHLMWLLSIKGEAFDYEMNILSATKDAHIPVNEVTIDTVYLNNNEASRFQPIRSSLRIYKVFLKFALSGLASFGLDIALFALFIWLWKDDAPEMYIVFATILARLLSSIFNYVVNRNNVFKNGDDRSVLKYIILAVFIMALSAGLVHGTVLLIGKGEVLIKGIVDSLLFFLGFVIQKNWVFKNNKPKHI